MLFAALIAASAAPARAELFSWGIKLGTPLTDAFNTGARTNIVYRSVTKPLVFGPSLELNLPAGASIEGSILYRRLNYDGSFVSGLDTIFAPTRASQWEFPFLLKYRFSPSPVRPYIGAGLSFDRLGGVTQFIRCTAASSVCAPGEEDPTELRRRSTAGLILAGGLEFKTPLLRLSPELRYTRRTSAHFQSQDNLLRSNQNQIEFIFGITF